jgi:carbohydrate-binding DOMON domain-containing protein
MDKTLLNLPIQIFGATAYGGSSYNSSTYNGSSSSTSSTSKTSSGSSTSTNAANPTATNSTTTPNSGSTTTTQTTQQASTNITTPIAKHGLNGVEITSIILGIAIVLSALIFFIISKRKKNKQELNQTTGTTIKPNL